MIPANQNTILLTIDVEDWFQVENLRPWFPPATWNRQQLRVEQNTHRILDLLDAINLNPTSTDSTTPRATFFILGWIAERLPNLVSEIIARGHEVASHGYSHLMCNQLHTQDLKEDLIRSKKTIEDITGVEVNGYRAPNFSINDLALQLVKNSGYRYDSSYNNFSRNNRYGTISINGAKKEGAIFKLRNDFTELPISNLSLAGQTIPWGGGGYFRFLPLCIFKAGVRQILRKTGAYIFYMHPWEIDANQPRVNDSKGLATWRHYLNVDKTYARLGNLISSFKLCKFPTCSQHLLDIA